MGAADAVSLDLLLVAARDDEWAEGRRYLSLDTLTKSQTVGTTDNIDAEEVANPELQAISA